MSSTIQRSDFFTAGGTLHYDAPSYVPRPADNRLRRLVQECQLCYVLTARQMGKSSAMIRTAFSLQQDGIRTAIVDLTSIGQAPVEEWLFSFLDNVHAQLHLCVDLEVWWEANDNLTYIRRFTKFIQEQIRIEISSQVAIFVDEVDSILSLDFSDAFFDAIRAISNYEASRPATQCLSFVLLGAAIPADIIKELERTPFNVGINLELADLPFEDASRILVRGLPDQDDQTLARVFYWTSGHPYLTQKFCRAIALSERQSWSDAQVDEMANQLFFSTTAMAEDSNLQYVGNQILTSPRSAQLLRLLRRVHQGELVLSDERSLLHSELKLYGLVTTNAHGHLYIRNRIYQHVFEHTLSLKDIDRFTSFQDLLFALDEQDVGADTRTLKRPPRLGRSSIDFNPWFIFAFLIIIGFVVLSVAAISFDMIPEPLAAWFRNLQEDSPQILQLTFGLGDDLQPSFSPDGRNIVFVSSRGGNQEIYLMHADGLQQQRLTNNHLREDVPTFTAGGEAILYSAHDGQSFDLYSLDLDDGETHNLTNSPESNEAHARASNSDTLLAYSSDLTGDWEVYSAELDNNELRNVNQVTFRPDFDDRLPYLFPLADNIVFRSQPVGVADESKILSLELDSQDILNLTPEHHNWYPTLSPDGKWVVFVSDREGNAELYAVDTLGKNLTRLTENLAHDSYPAFSPDGQWLAFASNRSGTGYDVYLMPFPLHERN